MRSATTILFILFTFRIFAQNPGSLDLSFNSNGYLITPVIVNGIHGASSAGDFVVLEDNSVVMAGSTYLTPQRYFSIIKYLDKGVVDSSFADNGVALVDLGLLEDYACCISTDNNGRLVVAGYSFNGEYNDIGIIRLNSNGSIDKTFGDSGKLVIPIGKSDSYAYDVDVLSDNSIVVAGKAFITDNFDFIVYKLLPDGKPDNTFGNKGLVSYNFGKSFDEATKVLVLENDKLLVGGSSNNGLDLDVTLALLTKSGQLDTTFNHSGFITWDYQGKTNSFGDMAIDSGGSIYVTGNTTIPGYYAPYIAKFTKHGAIDSTFATGGLLTYSIGEINAYSKAITVDDYNNIYATGYSQTWGQDIIVIKFNDRGKLDTNFGTEGVWYSDLGNEVTSKYCVSIGIKSNGKIIIGGSFDDDGYKFLIIQLHNTEAPNKLYTCRLGNELEIYPNPANNLLNIKWGNSNPVDIQILNINGKPVYMRKDFSADYIDVSDWETGIYLVYIKFGSTFSVRKLIIQ